MNLLRVWGGGIYETDDFYDVCDELGVLVWQDFLLACATYSEEEPLWGEFEAEARQAVARLAKHPSLIHLERREREHLGLRGVELAGAAGRPNLGRRLLHRTVPGDRGRAGSAGAVLAGKPVLVRQVPPSQRPPARHGPHLGRLELRGLQQVSRSDRAIRLGDGLPRTTGLVHADLGRPRRADGPNGHQMLVHQKAIDGNLKLERGIGDHLPMWPTEPQVDIDDWHWTTQLNQARAVAFGIAHFRSHYPLNRGTVVWSLNDNWPVISWAAVDGRGIRKPLWYALRDLSADRFLTIQPRSEQDAERPTLVLHNDSSARGAAR